MLTNRQQITKRSFDILVSFFGLIVLFPLILVLILLSSFFTKKIGLFVQERVGKNANVFLIYKIRTMKEADHKTIGTFGKWVRNSKLDELPQLYNVFIGNMSLVGPRPDIKGYADKLEGNDRIILSVRPGITGPATIKYSNEEALLAKQKDPKLYNDMVIWKDKVKINKAYVMHWSLINDVKYIIKTIFS